MAKIQLYSMEIDTGNIDMEMEDNLTEMPAMPEVPISDLNKIDLSEEENLTEETTSSLPSDDSKAADDNLTSIAMPTMPQSAVEETSATTPAITTIDEDDSNNLEEEALLSNNEKETLTPETSMPTQSNAEGEKKTGLQESMQVIETLKKELRDLYSQVNEKIQKAHTQSAQAHKLHLKILGSTPQEASVLETKIKEIKNEIGALEKEIDTIRTTKIQELSSKIDAEVTKAQTLLTELSKVGMRQELEEEFKEQMTKTSTEPVTTPAVQPQQITQPPSQRKTLIHTVFHKTADLIVGTVNLSLSLIMKIKNLLIPPTPTQEKTEPIKETIQKETNNK